MAGILTDEPVPRAEPGVWSEYWPTAARIESPAPPRKRPGRSFWDVLQTRRSALGGPVGFQQVADLLWYAMAPTSMGIGRAGLAIEHRPYPSAGGLHCIRLLMIDSDSRQVALYEPAGHRFHALDVPGVVEMNDAEVEVLVGRSGGCTLRLIADLQKANAAYHRPESLLLRDAGCLMATVALCADWSGLEACLLGALGSSIVAELKFPDHQYAGVGAIQITS